MMPHSLENAPMMLIMRCLYKEPQRGTKIFEEIAPRSGLSYDNFSKLLAQLAEENLIENIEKNKSNGKAVYKLTRAGEKLLEKSAHKKYEHPCADERHAAC